MPASRLTIDSSYRGTTMKLKASRKDTTSNTINDVPLWQGKAALESIRSPSSGRRLGVKVPSLKSQSSPSLSINTISTTTTSCWKDYCTKHLCFRYYRKHCFKKFYHSECLIPQKRTAGILIQVGLFPSL